MANIIGSSGDDKDAFSLVGVAGPDAIFGLAGADSLQGGTGGAIDILQGGAGADTLEGGAGNDQLDGGLDVDADVLRGGNNNDLYFWHSLDTIEEFAAGGTDTVFTDEDFDLTAAANLSVEHLILHGVANIETVGNALANQITGNEGLDTINGGDGNDTIDGGSGVDSVTGGLGNDTFVFKQSADANGDIVSDFEAAGENDTIDVTRIEPDANTATDDQFSFVGDLAGGNPGIGEIGFNIDPVSGDTNILFNDSIGVFSFVLQGGPVPNATDFNL